MQPTDFEMQEPEFDCLRLAHASFVPSADGTSDSNQTVASGASPHSYRNRQDDGFKRARDLAAGPVLSGPARLR